MRLARVLVAAVIGAVFGLAGCSGDDDPRVLPSATGPTTSPTATEPPTSEPTGEPTPTTTLVLPPTEVAEVDAFVRGYFAAYNAAQDSRDLAAFDAMYMPQCASCVEMREELVAWLADDAELDGADWVILQRSSVPIADNAGSTVLAYRTQGSTRTGSESAPIPQLDVQLFNLNVRRAEPWTIADQAFRQRVVRTIGALVGGACAAAFLQLPASDPGECIEFEVGPAGCVIDVSWQTIVDQETLTVHRLPYVATYLDTEGARWRAAFTPFCRDNVVGTTIVDDGLCFGALTICQRLGADDLAGMYMVITPLFIGPLPRLEGPICFGASSKIELGPIIEDMMETEIGADPPPIRLQPADAIVNLPMIASTDDRPPITINISDPIAGTATATPEFLWGFGDGAAAHGPGLPYDGTSPTSNPGYYVTNTYRALATRTVDLTVTWRVTFTIPGYPPVELADVVRGATASTTVRSAGSELIGG